MMNVLATLNTWLVSSSSNLLYWTDKLSKNCSVRCSLSSQQKIMPCSLKLLARKMLKIQSSVPIFMLLQEQMASPLTSTSTVGTQLGKLSLRWSKQSMVVSLPHYHNAPL